jgi:DNA-binding transcriptional ArsR family regulator
MSSNQAIPDYELAERLEVSTPAQLRAIADPLRVAILDLLLERAATVAELAAAVRRPKSTVAHHVGVLLDAELLRVVRTRRVRAIEERFYGRTARMFAVGVVTHPGGDTTLMHPNPLSVAAAESIAAYQADRMRATLRHARIPAGRATEFWERVDDLVRQFAQLPRSGDTVYGFVAGLYPTDFPTLPEPEEESADVDERRRA